MKALVIHAGSHAPSWQYAVVLAVGDKKYRLDFTAEKSGAEEVAAELNQALEDIKLLTYVRTFDDGLEPTIVNGKHSLSPR